MNLTIDSFAWVELIRGTRLGTASRHLIDTAGTAWTPTIVLAEVAHRCLQDGMPANEVLGQLQNIGESSETVPILPEIAIGASRATLELRARARVQHLSPPGLADGIILATARRFGSRLLTGDPHFRGLVDTLWLEERVRPPSVP